MSLAELTLLPLVEALRALEGSVVRLVVVRPSTAVMGRGILRTLRAQPTAEGIELLAGYEGYTMLPASLAAAVTR